MRLFSTVPFITGLMCLAGWLNQSHPDGFDSRPAPLLYTHTGTDWRPESIDDTRLTNAWRLHERVISGGLPDKSGMRALQELGVRTIISVDGARPDVALAEQYGMRYVHLPHGYDGISEERARELAKAVRDLEGPLYIHCHHGRHRSPAAAATACIAAGFIPAENGLVVLQTAGTSRNYRGLYQSVARTRPLDQALLDALNVEFPETVDVPPLAEAMVALEHTHDHLNLIAGNGWKPVPEHPDLEPVHEALLLREHFTELLRTDEVQHQPEEFQEWLRESEQAAQMLEDALRGLDAENAVTEPPAIVADSFEVVTEHCSTCHQRYRDVPLGERSSTAWQQRD